MQCKFTARCQGKGGSAPAGPCPPQSWGVGMWTRWRCSWTEARPVGEQGFTLGTHFQQGQLERRVHNQGMPTQGDAQMSSKGVTSSCQRQCSTGEQSDSAPPWRRWRAGRHSRTRGPGLGCPAQRTWAQVTCRTRGLRALPLWAKEVTTQPPGGVHMRCPHHLSTPSGFGGPSVILLNSTLQLDTCGCSRPHSPGYSRAG